MVSIQEGEKELERRETWQRAKGEIGSTPMRALGEGEEDDDDEDGDELDISSLSLGARQEASVLLDRDMAQKLLQVSSPPFLLPPLDFVTNTLETCRLSSLGNGYGLEEHFSTSSLSGSTLFSLTKRNRHIAPLGLLSSRLQDLPLPLLLG